MEKLTIKFSQDDFSFETSIETEKEITYTDAVRFLTLSFVKQMLMYKTLLPSNKRPSLSKPFSIVIETSEVGTLVNTNLKLSLPKDEQTLSKLMEKVKRVIGIALIEDTDAIQSPETFKNSMDELLQISKGQDISYIFLN